MERKEFCLTQIENQGGIVSQRKLMFMIEDSLDVKHEKDTNIFRLLYYIVSIAVCWLLY